jgi:c-di-AMP phosphodiesterase-like protein
LIVFKKWVEVQNLSNFDFYSGNHNIKYIALFMVERWIYISGLAILETFSKIKRLYQILSEKVENTENLNLMSWSVGIICVCEFFELYWRNIKFGTFIE